MPVFTVPITGANGPGFVTVNATDANSAAGNVGQGNVASGPATPGGPGGGAPAAGATGQASGGQQASTTAATSTASSGGQQLAAGINSLLGAIASGNKQAFDEAVRQFNLQFGLDKDKFTEAIRQFNQNFAISQSGVTGMYNGQETQQSELQRANLAAQQAGLTGYYQAPQGTGNLAMDAFTYKAGPADQQTYLQAEGGDPQKAAEHYLRDVSGAVRNAVIQAGGQYGPDSLSNFVYGNGAATGTAGVPTMAREQQTFSQQMAAIQAAAALQANPFRQQQVIGQLGSVLNPGGAGVAGFSAPNTVAGVGTAGGNTQGGMGYLQQMIDDIRSPGANQASMNNVLSAIPTPNKVNSTEFLRSAPSTQNLVLQGMQEKYGIDPQDALTQIKNTLPQFQAPTTVGSVKR
jgi:hypothetical protein